MNTVNIVLVKPGSQKQLYGELSAFNLTAIEPPMWPSLLAAYLRGQGYRVVLYDAEVEQWSYEETAENIKIANPMLAAVFVSGTNPSASTMNMTGAGAILAHLKAIAPETRTLLAGLHPSALPEQTLTEEQADFVCVGEGFHTLPELLNALKTNVTDYPIAGLWYKKDGKVVANPRAPLVENLDALPMPAWDLLPMDQYRAHNWHCFENIHDRQPYGVIYTSLGCPFKCTFCCINALFGKPTMRYRSPEMVIEEIDYLVNTWNIRNIKILDEMFALNEKHVVRFCDLIIERGYDLNMWAYARLDTVTESMLSKMRQAGIKWVGYGFESGSKRVLEGVNKRYNPDKVESIIKMTYDAGLYVNGAFVFGLPDDDYDSMRGTLDLAMGLNIEWVNFYTAMAYPGSQLHEIAIKNGWHLPETWQGYSQYAYETLPLPTKYLTASEVLRFRDQAFKEYFQNPKYIEKIRKTFGEETKNYVIEMLKKDLTRKYA